MLGRSKEPEIDKNEERFRKLEERLDQKDGTIAELVAKVHGYEKGRANTNYKVETMEDTIEDLYDTIYVIKGILGKVDFEIVNDINERLDILRRERKERREKEREAWKRLRR